MEDHKSLSKGLEEPGKGIHVYSFTLIYVVFKQKSRLKISTDLAESLNLLMSIIISKYLDCFYMLILTVFQNGMPILL